MPPNLVKPGLEKYWTKAKELAEEQGRGEDWAYIVGIFKRMTMNKAEGFEPIQKSDLRTSPVHHVIARWPGAVPDRKSLEANLMLRKVNAWSTPRPEPQVTQFVPSARYAVRNLGLDSQTEQEWIRYLENLVFPGVGEVRVRQAVLEKMMSDRMDPALRSVLWARVQALLKHVCRNDDRMAKAQGPVEVGKRGGKIYGRDAKGRPIYAPPKDKQLFGQRRRVEVKHQLQLPLGAKEAKQVGIDLPRYFPSGSNHVGEIEGFASIGMNVGVAADRMTPASVAALKKLKGTGLHVFVDSGAFGEMGFGPEGLYVKKPISPKEWEERLALYDDLAKTLGKQLHAVAPDRVGDQAVTLERLTRYVDKVRSIRDKGANILMPLQKGSMSLEAFDKAVSAVIGDEDYVRAIPMKKDATTTADLEGLLRSRKINRIHLLGLGETSKRYPEIMDMIKRVSPQTKVTLDSARITAAVGRSEGKAPRILTAAMDRIRSNLGQVIHHEKVGQWDPTEHKHKPSLWAKKDLLRWGAEEMGLDAADSKAFVEDPDEWLQEDDRYLRPDVDQTIDAMWSRFMVGSLERSPLTGKIALKGAQGTVVERKRESIKEAWGKEGPAPKRNYEQVTAKARGELKAAKQSGDEERIQRARAYLTDAAVGHAMVVHEALELGVLKPKEYDALFREQFGPREDFNPYDHTWLPKDSDLAKSLIHVIVDLRKGGPPYLGPAGGKYADPLHRIPWKEEPKTNYPKRVDLPGGRVAKIVGGAKGARQGDYAVYEKGRFVTNMGWSALKHHYPKHWDAAQGGQMSLELSLEKALTFDDAFDVLEKAAGHKYLRRWRGPDGKYRYEYKALATSTLKKYSVGDKVAVKHKGQEGHFEVLKVREKDGKRELYVKHDETGKERWVSEVVLAELFRQTHDVPALARTALHKISADLVGYDVERGPGVRKPKPTKHWAKKLKEREARLKHLFDPSNEYHSLMDFAAKQELMGWYGEELKDTVDQIKPIIAALNAEVEEAQNRGAGSSALWDIRTRYINETKEPFKKMLGGLSGLVYALNYAARGDAPMTPEGQKHEDPDMQKLIDATVQASRKLEGPTRQVQEAFMGIFTGKKDPEKWARSVKAKVTRYFNLLGEATFASTAYAAGKREYLKEQYGDSPITDKVAGKDATFLIHGREVKGKKQITDAIASMEGAIEKVKKAGFGRVLRDLTVHIDWKPESKRQAVEVKGHGAVKAAGVYHTVKLFEDKPTGNVTMYSTGFRDGMPSSVLVHELGHRLYYQGLTAGERNEWQQEVAKRTFTPTQAQVDSLWDEIKDKYESPGKGGQYNYDYQALIKGLNTEHGAIGRVLAGKLSSVYHRVTTSADKASVKEYAQTVAGHPAVEPFVSFYGGTNDSEYFAEAFMYYVDGGPRNVPAWTRSLLEKVTATQRMQKSLVLEPPQSLMHVVVDLLEKAQRGGKYIRRVPYTDRHGKTRYRYFYKESAAARSAQAGEEIKLGQKVAKVIAVQKNGDVTIAWDGNKQTFAADAWHRELGKHYGEQFEKSAERRAKQTVNAVLRHVPRHLLEDLKGETDEQRLAELKTRVPEVYDRLQKAFQRAGMNPFQAKRVLSATLERRGWQPEARAAAVGTVLTHRGTSITRLLDASENLAGGQSVEAKHVAAATELGAAGKGEPLSEIKNLAAQAERDVAKLASMLQALQEGKGNAAELFAEAMASKALQKLNLLSQAFPGLADRAVEPARQIVNEVAAETPRKPTREGAETVVYVAGEGGKPVALKARYRLVEADELIASHKPDTFAQREDYPTGVQERAYHRDKSEQAKVIRNAQRMDPRFVVNTNPDAVNGPPMTTTDGVVLGGNSRAMSMQRIYSQHPEKAAEMRQYLEDHAHEVGFKPSDIGAMKNPVLIREVDIPDKSKRNLQVLVRQMNESFTQGMDPRTMQVAMGRRLDQDTLKTLANDLGEDETLASFLGSKRSERFVKALHRAGIIDDRNANQYTIKGTNQLNQDGVQLVSRILVGRTVQDADILSNTGPQMIEAVARAIPALTQATAHGEGYDLGPDLAVAISAFNDLNQKVSQGVIRNLDSKMPAKDFADLFNHFRTLPGIAEPHPVLQNERATMLLELLVRRRGPTMMAKFGRDYAAEAAKHPEGQATMFGAGKSPTEVLSDTIERSLGKPTTGPKPTERLAASFVLVPEGDDILGKSFVVVNGEIRRLVG